MYNSRPPLHVTRHDWQHSSMGIVQYGSEVPLSAEDLSAWCRSRCEHISDVATMALIGVHALTSSSFRGSIGCGKGC